MVPTGKNKIVLVHLYEKHIACFILLLILQVAQPLPTFLFCFIVLV